MPQIHCNSIKNIQWLTTVPDTFNTRDNIHVWRVKISEGIKFLNDFPSILNIGEKEKAASYKNERDKNRSIISRGVLRMLIGKYINLAPKKIEFEKALDHKPFVGNTAGVDLHYNVSHSGDWILIAVAENAIGIDIEEVDRNFDYREILTACFSDAESNYIHQSLQPQESFYTLWTRKEALIKATAKGLDDEILLIPCMDGDHEVNADLIHSTVNWEVRSFQPEESYVAGIAHQPLGQEIVFYEAGNFIKELEA